MLHVSSRVVVSFPDSSAAKGGVAGGDHQLAPRDSEQVNRVRVPSALLRHVPPLVDSTASPTPCGVAPAVGRWGTQIIRFV